MKLIFLLFRCKHKRISWPQTAMHRGVKGATTICCLDCAARFAYSWKEMRVGEEVHPQGPLRTWQTARGEGLA